MRTFAAETRLWHRIEVASEDEEEDGEASENGETSEEEEVFEGEGAVGAEVVQQEEEAGMPLLLPE